MFIPIIIVLAALAACVVLYKRHKRSSAARKAAKRLQADREEVVAESRRQAESDAINREFLIGFLERFEAHPTETMNEARNLFERSSDYRFQRLLDADPDLKVRYQASCQEYGILNLCTTKRRQGLAYAVERLHNDEFPEIKKVTTLDEVLSEIRPSGSLVGDRLCQEIAGVSFAELEAELHSRADELYAQLTTAAETDRESFVNLEVLIRTSHGSASCLKSRNYAYPERWNQWVVRHNTMPLLGNFQRVRAAKDLPSGTVSKWLEDAVIARDIVNLAIVLAYCHDSAQIRAVVGDVLYAKAVETYTALRTETYAEVVVEE